MRYFVLFVLVFLVSGCVYGLDMQGGSPGKGNITNRSSGGVGAMLVEKGDTVRVDYVGTFENGIVFDSSEGREPLEFVAAAGQMIKGFDQAVIGMKVGDEKDIVLQPGEAYGEHNPELVQELPISQLPEGANVSVGEKLIATNQLGQPVQVTIAEVENGTVKIDLNHPLAGKVLKFHIKLVEILGK